MALQLLYGVGLLLVAATMIWFARPARGQDSAPFLRVWIVGQIYLMAAMVSSVIGVTLLISNWP